MYNPSNYYSRLCNYPIINGDESRFMKQKNKN
uniref:Uncharacterized protein n=1 Tax=Anguilla anguilla TaxID=7936 RepID=A0A0E9RLQ1_ANGAN